MFLDPDHSVSPDLDPNNLHRLSADSTSRQRVPLNDKKSFDTILNSTPHLSV